MNLEMPRLFGEHFPARLVGRDEDALRAFRSAEALVDDVLQLPLLQLSPKIGQKEAGSTVQATGMIETHVFSFGCL